MRQEPDTEKRWRQFVVLLTTCCFAILNLCPTMGYRKIDCVEDQVHRALDPVNSWFARNEGERNAAICALTLTSDFVFLWMVADWVLHQKSWRLPITIVLMLLCRVVCAVSKPGFE